MQESTADVPGRTGKQDELVAALLWARRGQPSHAGLRPPNRMSDDEHEVPSRLLMNWVPPTPPPPPPPNPPPPPPSGP